MELDKDIKFVMSNSISFNLHKGHTGKSYGNFLITIDSLSSL